MNPLPQRKKSAEEIAILRESFGMPPAPFTAETEQARAYPVATVSSKIAADPPVDAMVPVDDAPPLVHARPQFRTFKRSERSPQPETGALPHAHAATAEAAIAPQVAAMPSAGRRRRPLRLQRSAEQAAAPAPSAPAAESKLPVQRHSVAELADARRRDALAVISQGAYEVPGAAHPALLAIGYGLAIGGAAAPTLLNGLSRLTDSYTLGLAYGGGYHLLTAATLAALPVAGFIYCCKTLSRHHAAFIAIIVFFALVFAVLHYIPQLRHAT